MKARLILFVLSLTSVVVVMDSPIRADHEVIDVRRVKAIFNVAIPPDIDAWAQQRDGTVVLRNDTLKLVAIELAPGVSGAQVISDLMARGDVQVANYDGFTHAQHVRTPLVPNPPNDPRWPEQYGPRLIQLGLAGPANDGWDYEQGSTSVILAVLDTGVDASHEDLANACLPHCAQAGYDVYGHGTHVAGIAAARANNANPKGVAGIAQVKLMSRRALRDHGGGYLSEAAVAVVDAATQGAKVLNMSFGGQCNYLTGNICFDLEKAIELAHDSHGAVLV